MSTTAKPKGADVADVKRRYGFDLIDLETVRYGLIEIASEMNETLTRSSFSPVARDVRDCTSAVHVRTEAGWEMVASHEGCVQHAFTSPHIVNFTMSEWDESTLQEGDVILVNDPWRGAIHYSDLNVLRPIFVDGRLEYVLHSTSHVADLGGPTPGGFANGAQTQFEEQLKIPPVLLYASGVPVRPVFNHLLENNRTPNLLLGDLRALAGSLSTGASRLSDLIDRYGLEHVRASGDYALDLAESAMRNGIRGVADGDYEIVDFLDEDGVNPEQIRLQMTLKIRGDSMEIDYSGTSRQPAGNIGTAWIESTRAIIGAKFLLDPYSPVNSGTLRPIEALLPAGSMVCVLPPSSSSSHDPVGSRVVNMMTQALSAALGVRGIACDTGTSGVAVIGGVDTRPGHEGAGWGSFAVPGGGWGGTWDGDGISACIISIGANCRSSVIEHVERESPLVIWEHELMPDSSGAGQHRGGAGAILTIGAISPTVITITGDRCRIGAPGIAGGGRGMPLYGWLLLGDGSGETLDPRQFTEAKPLFGVFDEDGNPDPDNGTFGLGTVYKGGKVSQLILRPGDGLRIIVGGGGGWGDPLEREPERVLLDVEDRLLSEGLAREAYGVVLAGGEVDEDATALLRRDLARLRDEGRWSVPTACPPSRKGLDVMEVGA